MLSKYIETKLKTTLFYFIGLEPASLPHFLHDFRRKIFILSYSINCPGFIARLPLCREILGNICVVIVF